MLPHRPLAIGLGLLAGGMAIGASLVQRFPSTTARIRVTEAHVTENYGQQVKSVPESDRQQRPTASSGLSRLLEVLSSILGVSAVLVGSVFALRVLFVAGFDPNLATALITNTSAPTLVTTAATQILPVVLLGASWLVIGYAVRTWKRTTWAKGLLLILAALLLAFPGAMQVDPLNTALLVASLPAAAMSAQSRDGHQLWKLVLAGLGGIALIVAVLGHGMWLPAERLTIKGSEPTAYVLETNADDVVLFRTNPRRIERVPLSAITGREFCHPGRRARGDYVADYLYGVPKLPACPH